jgi:hypothetical protein
MVRVFLIVEMPHASYKGRVAFAFRPVYRFLLSPKSGELMVGVIFDDVVLDGRTFGSAFRPRFNINVCHDFPSL